jgi:hypothetical protein
LLALLTLTALHHIHRLRLCMPQRGAQAEQRGLHRADAALTPAEAATEVQEGGAVPEHEEGEPLVDEGAEEEELEDPAEIPKE